MHRMRRRITVLAVLAACATALAVVAPTAGGASEVSESVRQKAVAWGVEHVGIREIGTTNCSPTIDRWERDMGLRLPPCRVWCGAFVHQAYLRAGVRLSKRLIDPHRSFYDAVNGRRHLRKIAISAIRPGDIVFYKFRKGVRASHLALARSRPKNGMLNTVEGNVDNASSMQSRGTKYIVLAARVTR
jgi:hypothetical protein